MTIEQLPAIVPLAVFLGGCLATAWRVGYVVASFMGKIDKQMLEQKAEFNAIVTKMNEQMAAQRSEFNALLELKEAEYGQAIGRVYQRFDEYKTHLESSFVRREMCQMTHNGNAAALARIEEKQGVQGDKLDALILKVAGMK